MSAMRVYWIKAQAPRRVLALAKHLGLPVEFVWVDASKGGLRTPEYRQLNPNAKAPTLVHGETVLWEASAIMAYLCIEAGSDMWPTDNPREQVEVLRWLSWNDCHWLDSVGAFYFEHIVKPEFGLGEPDRDLLAAKMDGLLRYAKVLDAALAGRDFIACGRLTIADFQLASMAADWRAAEMPFGEFPNIIGWLDRLEDIPAWADPWPEKS